MSSTYCTATNVKTTFGTRNVETWANLDGDADASEISSQIDRAIAVAGEQIDSRMRMSHHAVPVVDYAGSTPTLIEEIAATLAGVWLFEGRGDTTVDGEGKPMHRYRWKLDWANGLLDDIAEGRRKIDAR